MALYNLHIARGLPGGFVLSLFPETSEGVEKGFEKLRYQNAGLLLADLRELGVAEEELDKLNNADENRFPVVLTALPVTKADLTKICATNTATYDRS